MGSPYHGPTWMVFSEGRPGWKSGPFQDGSRCGRTVPRMEGVPRGKGRTRRVQGTLRSLPRGDWRSFRQGVGKDRLGKQKTSLGVMGVNTYNLFLAGRISFTGVSGESGKWPPPGGPPGRPRHGRKHGKPGHQHRMPASWKKRNRELHFAGVSRPSWKPPTPSMMAGERLPLVSGWGAGAAWTGPRRSAS